MASLPNPLTAYDEVAARLLGLSADVVEQLGPAANVLAGEDEKATKRRRRQTTLVDLGEEVIDLGEEVVDLAEEVVEAAEQPKKKKKKMNLKIEGPAPRSVWSCDLASKKG
ncbi:MAG: hypothetical protein LQ339_003285 [Xanthoria mediterranea]|nr:MAG: hypothetical protein LQ339_003285 [Xanthoria mediterranea]